MNKPAQGYDLIDSGDGRKLERFGRFVIDRPCSQAVWKPKLSPEEWKLADAFFTREGQSQWKKGLLPNDWIVKIADVLFKISPTDFGHLGIFPEQLPFWLWMQKKLEQQTKPLEVLNLFAYSGGATLACAKAGAKVCHVDASKTTVAWARENASLNHLDHGIRWIIDDALKFLKRELKRGHTYDVIILDPPSYGRGAKGEVFKIEDHIQPLLELCRSLLSPKPLFLLFSCHTPGFTPLTMHNLLSQALNGLGGVIDMGEMALQGESSVLPVPSGTFARWIYE